MGGQGGRGLGVVTGHRALKEDEGGGVLSESDGCRLPVLVSPLIPQPLPKVLKAGLPGEVSVRFCPACWPIACPLWDRLVKKTRFLN